MLDMIDLDRDGTVSVDDFMASLFLISSSQGFSALTDSMVELGRDADRCC